MQSVCVNCGQPLAARAAFCRHCGASVQATAEPACVKCGAKLLPNVKFCRACGTAVGATPVKEVSVQASAPVEARAPKPEAKPVAKVRSITEQVPTVATVKHTVKSASRMLGSVAASSQGDMTFDFTPAPILGGLQDVAAPMIEMVGPLKLLLGSFMGLVRNLGGALKDKKRLIPALLFGVIWIVLTLLPALGVSVPGGQFLSWLTFAQGGLRGGIPGFLGGVFGKGLLVSMLTGLLTAGKRQKRQAGSVKEKLAAPVGKLDLGLMLAGIGVAFCGYNLMTGDNSLQNSMIGIVTAIASLRSLLSGGGFLRRLLTAIGQKLKRGRQVSTGSLNRFTVGMTAGFAVAVPLSLTGISWIGYLLGGLLFATGAGLALLNRTPKQKGAVA